ncbi:hypothetical protein BASA81_004477 [Batrachochytrium salamandrivorans]|nr:hypothetical protein BASA81_004477 [Batrachochytrium salamandrivorans]
MLPIPEVVIGTSQPPQELLSNPAATTQHHTLMAPPVFTATATSRLELAIATPATRLNMLAALEHKPSRFEVRFVHAVDHYLAARHAMLESEQVQMGRRISVVFLQPTSMCPVHISPGPVGGELVTTKLQRARIQVLERLCADPDLQRWV